jgi:hypothetical protein
MSKFIYYKFLSTFKGLGRAVCYWNQHVRFCYRGQSNDCTLCKSAGGGDPVLYVRVHKCTWCFDSVRESSTIMQLSCCIHYLFELFINENRNSWPKSYGQSYDCGFILMTSWTQVCARNYTITYNLIVNGIVIQWNS